MGVFGDGCSFIITNVGVESSDKHKTFIEDLFDVILVGLEVSNAVEVERFTGISHKADRLKYVFDDQWLENVELKVAIHSSDGHSSVVSHDLGTDHSNGFALSRVDLTGHDRRSRLILRQGKFS